jgi:hypothetical protein
MGNFVFVGVVRFRDRVLSLLDKPMTSSPMPSDSSIERNRHKTIKKVTQDIEKLAFNTAISEMMIFTNFLLGKGCWVILILGPDEEDDVYSHSHNRIQILITMMW